jgi:hypothetical protein
MKPASGCKSVRHPRSAGLEEKKNMQGVDPRSLARPVAGISAVLLAVFVLVACNRNGAPTQTASAPAPSAGTAAPPAAPAPAAPAPKAIPPNTELPIVTVDSVMLTHPEDAPGALQVQVSGTVPSGGWTGVKLMPDEASAATETETFKFVATSPQQGATAAAPQSVEAEIRLDTLPPTVKTIRILAGTNEVSAPVTQ